MAKLVFEIIRSILMLVIQLFSFALSISCAVGGKIQTAIYLLLMALFIEVLCISQYLMKLAIKQGDADG